ncbi:helix-turn-helix domain-containing protein [Leucobacter ruminantium]|uniref:Helix-turn-helix domain-containing protein n=1 Tax=Leucobacter ruminantium TaxID=1289170 RepID=A0A939RZH8_9MICO|nr:helix-turn-helix domain-containing protein [Leucobacter ruminantium]MBO1805866.1 helix-turn-helix domain-containing protein [Leucobacter ruminantium]
MAEGFAAIPTWMFREHERVSLYAVMVFGSLATRAGLRGNYPSQATLAEEARCSERKVRDALAELEALGVVERVKRGSKAGGRLPDGYRLMDRPLDAQEFPAPCAGKGEGFPAQGAEVTGTSVHSFLSIEVDSSEVDKCADAHAHDAHSFEDWWKAYPLKKDKGRARTAYKAALKKTSAEVLISAAVAYRADPNREQAYTKYPASWLNAEAWENGPLPPRGGGRTAVEIMADRARQMQSGGGPRELST